MRPCCVHDELGCPMARINRVDGNGPVPCDIMLIGEAPGKIEDKKGKPFVGKSGSELDHLYLGKCANIARRNVRVDNLVKCRTNEKDRNPNAGEIDACSQLLMTEIGKVRPRFVGLVGGVATKWFLSDRLIEKVHGFAYSYYIGFDITLMPLYHPAFGLHNTAMMRHIMEDWTRFGKMVRGDESVMWKERE